MKARATYGHIPPLFDRFPHQSKLTPEKLQEAARLLRPGSPSVPHIDINNIRDLDQHIQDALLYGRSARLERAPAPTIESFSDAEMVMEMLRRGYAVVKSKDGSMPEVLDD